MSRWMDCQECGLRVEPADAYHPFLFCELVKLRHRDPMAYLASYGFERSVDTHHESAIGGGA